MSENSYNLIQGQPISINTNLKSENTENYIDQESIGKREYVPLSEKESRKS